MLQAGVITKPQGIRGEVRANPLFDVPADFLKLKRVFIADKPYAVLSARVDGRAVIVRLSGVESRNDAEALRGAVMLCDPADMPRLPEGRYYIAQLLGAEVFAGSTRLGTLSDVLQLGAADVYEVAGPRPFSFPAIEGVIREILPEEGRIVLDPDALREVAVYED